MRARRLAVAGGCALATLLAHLSLVGHATGQEVRGWTTTTFRFVEVRPLERVVVDPELLVEDADGRLFLDGEEVRCPSRSGCVLYRPAPVQGATAATQDLGFTAWDLGVQGLSFTTLLRGRARFGGDFVWPRSDDAFDAIVGFAELNRDKLRVRLGRQRSSSGLGFTGFDGASVLVRPLEDVVVEGYGGRSLARGLAEPRNEALRGIEDFVLDDDAWLVGGFLQTRLDGPTEVGLRYQREIWANRSGLISERASLDVRSEVLRPYRLRGSVDWDVGFGRLGKSSLEVQRSFPDRQLLVSVEARRYVPYFELSTVWGFFSPVAYHEVLGRVAWSRGDLGAWAEGGWRSYEDTHTVVIFDPLEDDGWRARVGATYVPGPAWSVRGSYDVEWGVGAFLSAADATVAYQPREGLELSASGTTFQRIEEFRLGDGRVLGGSLGVGWDVRDDLRFDGGAALYRHDPNDASGDGIWNQTRIWTALRFDFGEDPGRPRVRLRR